MAPNDVIMGVFVGDLDLGGCRLVSDIVDAVVLVGLAVGVDHGSIVSLAGEKLLLQVPLLVAVPADDVWVSGAAGVGLAVVASRAAAFLWRKAVVVSPDVGNLPNLLVRQFLPDDVSGLLGWKFGLDSVDPVQPLMIILDSFQVAGSLHAFIEGCLSGLQDLVADTILKAGQEELVLVKLEGVCNAFSFGLVDSGASKPDSSHGGRLVVSEAFVGHLNAIRVVIDGLV
jgi:hypothetical protein